MEGKKISFGFMKTKKADKPVIEEKKDFIECVEEKAIKVVGGEEVKENTPLVIPMKPNTLVTAERLKQIAEKVESALEEPEIDEKPPLPQEIVPENETLDQMAVRELLQNAKKEVNVETPQLTVPLPAKPVNEGEKESTLDDYENVPVQDFGMAMLRGMGWAEGKEKSSYKQPQLRPKGLGLGADKVVKGNQKPQLSKDGKDTELTIVKNAYVKITTGKYSGFYGKVLGLDEDNGRVMVDITVKKETVSLGEFMMQPVPKSEFDKESKVLNAGSFEEYNKKEALKKSKYNDKESTPDGNKDRNMKDDSKYKEREATSSKVTDNKYDRDEKSRYDEKDKDTKNGNDNKELQEDRRDRDRDRDRSNRSRHRRDSTEERSRRKKDKRYSSNDSLHSLSDSEQRRHKNKERKSPESASSSDKDRKKRNKKKERRRRDSSDSESDHRSKRNKTPEGKRDIDKKRKGKKKKRDRDRSPNYRKHRK